MSTVVPEPGKSPFDEVAAPQLSPRPERSEESDEPIIVHVSAFAFLRTMWSLLWTAFRHPLTTTHIDVATGKVLDTYEETI